MGTRRILSALVLTLLSCLSSTSRGVADDPKPAPAKSFRDARLDQLPDDVLATIEARNRALRVLASTGDELGYSAVVDLTRRWVPGDTVRVAFLGGSAATQKAVADALVSVADAVNIKFDLGLNPQSGQYRTWTTSDSALAAEIRVSFDQPGYFSLIGTDSVSAVIGSPAGAVGGRPYQRSLNLSGFDKILPADGAQTIRHEFLHALAFKHEHQHPDGECENDFRWEDDEGYVDLVDEDGRHIAHDGKRPGIYTYLSGYPNYWSRAKADYNLKRLSPSPDLWTGKFDSASIMLYRFDDSFYLRMDTPCIPNGQTNDLSAGDRFSLAAMYPKSGPQLHAVLLGLETFYRKFLDSPVLDAKFKSSHSSFTVRQMDTVQRLK